ncbi:hypothetical protein V5O48_014005 [Marasmius crinis-equi]|uniref:SGNH hydrolase-type esterase domain-containing protein n=1 Tax=Marasmius crinis-equi TaxID=585013 RepID=A0ABR3EYI0_9AGAR
MWPLGINRAVSGASTNSHIDQGHWKTAHTAIKSQVAAGRRTIVTIQFGHNDYVKVGKPQEFAENLVKMVKNVRAAKAEPVLVTPLVKTDFSSNNTIVDDLAAYAARTVAVAKQEKVPLVDLHRTSVIYCEAIGKDAARRLNNDPARAIHVNRNGAVVYGRMVADLLNAEFRLAGLNLLPIVPNPELSRNISQGIPSY